jgi:hypothetical protein
MTFSEAVFHRGAVFADPAPLYYLASERLVYSPSDICLLVSRLAMFAPRDIYVPTPCIEFRRIELTWQCRSVT